MTDQYAVMGNPIAQSKSPEIHRIFAQQTGQDLDYTKLLVPIDQFKTEVKKFFTAGGKGLNITVPFKLQAWQLLATEQRWWETPPCSQRPLQAQP